MNTLPGDFLKHYESALASQQWKLVDPLIHDNACVTFSDGSIHIGKTEVKRAYERNFKVIQDEEYRVANVVWVKISPDYAVCIYDFEWEGIIQGELASGCGRGTMIIIQDDGHWKMLAEHLGPKA